MFYYYYPYGTYPRYSSCRKNRYMDPTSGNNQCLTACNTRPRAGDTNIPTAPVVGVALGSNDSGWSEYTVPCGVALWVICTRPRPVPELFATAPVCDDRDFRAY